MKGFALLSLALSVAALPQAATDDRAAEGHIVVSSGTAPAAQELKPKYGDYAPGAKRTKVRYGKYSMPSVNAVTPMSLLTGEAGTSTGISIMLAKPCQGDCSLLVAQAGLEYANGTVADIDSGAWLHHIVMLTGGMGRKDSTCGIFPGERFFSSGNERTPTSFGDVTGKKVKTAYPLRATDAFFMQYELMNMIDTPQDVFVTVDFEYMPGKLPAGWRSTKAMWFDVTGCPGISSVRAPAGKRQFTLSMPPWTSPFSGTMLGVGGHLHDGGVKVDIFQNNKVICQSDANYEDTEIANMDGSAHAGMTMAMPAGHGHKKRDGGHGHGDPDAKHITQMTTCTNLGPLNKGDVFKIDAVYDFDKFEGMKGPGGEYTAVMGIAIMYSATDV